MDVRRQRDAFAIIQRHYDLARIGIHGAAVDADAIELLNEIRLDNIVLNLLAVLAEIAIIQSIHNSIVL